MRGARRQAGTRRCIRERSLHEVDEYSINKEDSVKRVSGMLRENRDQKCRFPWILPNPPESIKPRIDDRGIHIDGVEVRIVAMQACLKEMRGRAEIL
uniref:Uncharacterized protein n=1 Tax=Candidatus Kentrum sp. MB TaxID=2138164 RepID=A0A450XJA1_9GAMM|nr:MAG: hypothetical protein BECKMB1821G_GA0114241_104822 [Candidatus Kentron sp. MB]